MRLRDLLTLLGFKELNILKYEKHVDEEIQAKLKLVDKSKVTIIDNRVVVNLPAIELKDEMLPNAERILQERAGFVRNDLVLPEVGMLATASRSKKVLEAFRGCVAPGHFHAMIAAASVVHWEDIGEHEVAEVTFTGLVKKFGSDGKKIYNFHRSGYLEGYFLATLAMMKFQATAEKRYEEGFAEFFRLHLEYFPFAIWSNEFTTFADIREALDQRFVQDTVATVRVYARGLFNIDKVETICDAYVAAHPRLVYLLNRESYRIGTQRACCMVMQRHGVSVHEPRLEKRKGP